MGTDVSHRRGEHVRVTVLDAAFDELVENGATASTVAGVARRSGVHETTIYRRWVTKENLFLEAMLNRSADAIPTPDTGSVREDLLIVVRAVVAYVTSPAGRAGLNAIALPADDGYHAARRAFWAGRLDALRPIVERGIARGELKPDTDAALLFEALVAPVNARILLTDAPFTADLAAPLVDLVLDGATQR
jgi:AcrR family transcriptional regulator